VPSSRLPESPQQTYAASNPSTSNIKFPGQHDATDFDRPTPVCLTSTTFGLKDRPIAVQIDNGTPFD
jgi:hypothetical protein